MSINGQPGTSARQTWDDYFLGLAAAAATRSNCTRRVVGAVLVQGRHVRATGYNGPPSGYGHCDEGACPRGAPDPGGVPAAAWEAAPTGSDSEDERCVAVHAEANALLFAEPRDRAGATLYATGAPCFSCAKLIANSGVGEVVAGGGRYEGWDTTRRFLQDCEVRVRVLDGQEYATPLPLRF